ncbi:hypothetical protein PMAYCL1PPCAC_15588, partial [Pristionchus mayeri]
RVILGKSSPCSDITKDTCDTVGFPMYAVMRRETCQNIREARAITASPQKILDFPCDSHTRFTPCIAVIETNWRVSRYHDCTESRTLMLLLTD